MNIILSQNEADELIQMEKKKINDKEYTFPVNKEKILIPLLSHDEKHQFQFDVHSKGRSIELKKYTYQQRNSKIFVLYRLDLAGPPHRNPDGERLECPHLHVYTEKYGSKFAIPIPEDLVIDENDYLQTLINFMSFCNITVPPNITKGLYH